MSAFESLFLLVIFGLLAMVIGPALFGIAALRAPVLSRAPWLPLATAVAGFIAFPVLGSEIPTAGFLVFRTLFAFGLIGLGVVLWLDASDGAVAVP